MASVDPVTDGQITTDGTEQTIYQATIAQPVALDMDMANMQAGDVIVLRIYKKIRSGGSLILFFEEEIYGESIGTATGFNGQPMGATYEIKYTIERTSGGDRAYDWGVWRAI